MSQELITKKIEVLKKEFEQADGELSKLRPRVAYLEQILQRCDGAMVVLEQLLKESQDATVVGVPVGTNHQGAALVPEGV
jgi:uncharacterized protein involved in exopolysaccharide biosynthesis